MKKLLRITAGVLAGVMITGAAAAHSGAVRFSSTDSNTAVAGAAAALKNYLESNNGSTEEIAALLTRVQAVNVLPAAGPDESVPETIAASTEAPPAEINPEEVLYDVPRIGVANVQAVLNVRKEQTTLSDIVAFVVRGAEIEVLGERYANNNKWYKVRVSDTEGYVAGNLVVFGEDAEKMRQMVADEAGVMPENFEITEDLTGLDSEIQEHFERIAKEISWVLRVDYPNSIAKDDGDPADTYSILIYLLELYQEINELANEYGITALYDRTEKDIGVVETNRQKLSEATGFTENEWVAFLVNRDEEAAAARQAELEEVQRQAREAEAAYQAYLAELQRQQEEAAAAAAAAAAEQTQGSADTGETQAAQETQPADTLTPEQQAELERLERERQEAAAREEEQRRQAEAEAAAQQQLEQAQQEQTENATGRAIADFAASWVGRINYRWGGDDFFEGGGVDCSHFTYHVFLQYGLVGGYTTSYGQRGWGYAVDISQILVCYNGHVAIYYGNGLIVHAPAPGRMIEIGGLNPAGVVGVRRLY